MKQSMKHERSYKVLRRVQQKTGVVLRKQGNIAFCFNIVRCIIPSFNAYIGNESFFIGSSKFWDKLVSPIYISV